MGKGWVYVMRRKPDGAVKVGKSVDPDGRLKAGRTWIPEGLDIVFLFPCARTQMDRIEDGAQGILRQYQIAPDGAGDEWFSCDQGTAVAAVRTAGQGLNRGLPGMPIDFRVSQARSWLQSAGRFAALTAGVITATLLVRQIVVLVS